MGFIGELLLHQTEMSKIVKELTTMRQSADKYKSSKKNYEIKFHEVEILKQRLSQNAHHQVYPTTEIPPTQFF